ncbi:hypothetical protein [Hathewaya massiliensis]|uniref:hypothetical protein n=1 Tax=Hathewaya massiliensis TaxID=1964382 RepID=UPI00163C9AC0|nr:hypothetical protein [Hathewaya massiliensis]
MNRINWDTVIASIAFSTITVQIIIKTNIIFLNKKLLEFKHDIIESCTDGVAEFIKKLN